MTTDALFSAEFVSVMRCFETRFGARIRIDEPSGENLPIDIGDSTYVIDKICNIDDFKQLFTESLSSGVNLISEKCKGKAKEYEDNTVY